MPSATPLPLPSRLSLNQATIRYAELPAALAATRSAGIESIGLWREPVARVGARKAVELLSDSGLRMSSLCRSGYVTSPDPADRRRALDDCLRSIDETALLASSMPGSSAVLVFVAGGLVHGSRSLPDARSRVRDALGELEAVAERAGVTLAIEALHPMYAADLGVVSTLEQAVDLAEQFGPAVGVVIDAFHTWWDPRLVEQIARAGRHDRIASVQLSDWITPLPSDVLLGRGMMGDGHIDFTMILRSVEQAGYAGDIEVEIFNQAVWDSPFDEVAARVARAFREHVDALPTS